MINSDQIGVLYDFNKELDEENYAKIISLIEDKSTPSRCHKFSIKHFSLDMGSGQYSEIYKNL